MVSFVAEVMYLISGLLAVSFLRCAYDAESACLKFRLCSVRVSDGIGYACPYVIVYICSVFFCQQILSLKLRIVRADICIALCRLELNTGIAIAASTAMTAITISISIIVKPLPVFYLFSLLLPLFKKIL